MEPWLVWTIAGSGIAIAVVILLIGTTLQPVATSTVIQGSSNAEPDINTRTANLLELDPLTRVHVTAPGFTLTSQAGKPLHLSDFRGEAVVLSFNDDRCTDLCTLLAQDVLQADHDLGTESSKVAFVSINANPFYPSSADLNTWDEQHGLADTSNWKFGTGSPQTLKSLAHAYGVPVDLNQATKTITHGSELFFIDPSGVEKAIGQFGTESADTTAFAHAMAQMAVDTLPKADRPPVAGRGLPAPTSSGTQLGATPAPVVLPGLDHADTSISTSSDRGKYTVLNFWSSTCTACATELPALEAEHRSLGSRVAFLGIDVSDIGTAARESAARAGITYPLVTDPTGTTAGHFAISGLPFTVVLDSQGKVIIRHPGIITQHQLDYLLRTVDTSIPAAAN